MEKSKPTLVAHVVTEAKSPEGKSFWHRVGAVWPHKDGIGFDIANLRCELD